MLLSGFIWNLEILSWIKDEWVVMIYEGMVEDKELMIYDVRKRSMRKQSDMIMNTYDYPKKMLTYFPTFVSPMHHP